MVDGAVPSYIYDTSIEDPLAFDDITLEFDSTASPILKRRWMHSDAVDEPVGFEAYTASSGVGPGTEPTMFADRQGSVIWVTEPATGQVVAGYEYDGYGQITQTTGTLSQPYGYTGREYDAESGLYHYRARAYDPVAGVFVQVDPIEFEGGQYNLTQYVSANPFGFIDPTGLSSTYEFVNDVPSGQASSVSATAQVSVGALHLVGNINAALAATLPYATKMDPETRVPMTTPPGACSMAQYLVLEAEVTRWSQPGTCLPVPEAIFGTPKGMAMRLTNLSVQRGFAKLAVARAALAAACFPGYYGKGDHRQAGKDALFAMAFCQKTVQGPMIKGK